MPTDIESMAKARRTSLERDKAVARALLVSELPEGMRLFRRMVGNRRLCDQTVLNLLLGELAKRGRIEEVRWLLHLGAEPNWNEYGRRSALGGAIDCGNLEIFRMLIQHGASLSSPHNEMTYLGMAAFSGVEEIMEEILHCGADPNARAFDREGMRWDVPPLIIAIAENHRECVQLLLRYGADPNVVCYDLCAGFSYDWLFGAAYDCLPADLETDGHEKGPPCTPLMLAETTGNRAIGWLLREYGAISRTHAPIGAEMVKIRAPIGLRARAIDPVPPVVELIRSQAGLYRIRRKLTWVHDLNANDGCLLSEACLSRSPDVIRHLLELGADPNVLDRHTLSDLDGGRTEIARLLLDHGYNGKVQRCHVPLEQAIGRGHLQLVRLLLDRGCDLDASPILDAADSPRLPPLMSAIQYGQRRCAAYLMERGANPNVVSRGFPNPAIPDGILHWLREDMHSFSLGGPYHGLWLDQTGDIMIDSGGIGTPLHLAVLNLDLRAAALLMKYGADPSLAPDLDHYVEQVHPPELRAQFEIVLGKGCGAAMGEPPFGSFKASVHRDRGDA